MTKPTTTRMADTVSRECVRCTAPPTVCSECMRATALRWFGAVARHPESGTDCRLCEHGPATYCGNCFVDEVASYRTALREAGNPITGEPSCARGMP